MCRPWPKPVTRTSGVQLFRPDRAARTPPAIAKKLRDEVAKALAAPDVADLFSKQGMAPVANEPAEFGELIKTDLQRWTTEGRRQRGVGLFPLPFQERVPEGRVRGSLCGIVAPSSDADCVRATFSHKGRRGKLAPLDFELHDLFPESEPVSGPLRRCDHAVL